MTAAQVLCVLAAPLMPVQTETGNPDLTSADPIRQAAAAVQKPYSAAAADDRPDRNSYSLCFRNCNSGKSKFSYDPLFLGNTAQSWRCRYAVRFFVRLYENDAAGLTPSKEFSCKMTENMQVDALPSRQAGFVRCCLYDTRSGLAQGSVCEDHAGIAQILRSRRYNADAEQFNAAD